MTTFLVLLLMLFCTLLGGFGAVFIKLGAHAFRLHIPSLLRNKYFILGTFMYCASAVVYLYLLKYLPLAIAYPLTSLTYVWVTILSTKYLKEKVDAWRAAGIAAIVIGIVLLNIR